MYTARRRIMAAGVSVAALAGIVGGLAPSASAEAGRPGGSDAGGDVEAIADLVSEVAPPVVGVDIAQEPQVDGEVTVVTDQAIGVVPLDAQQPIVLESVAESQRPALEVPLPPEVAVDEGQIASDGTIVFPAADEGTSVAVQMFDDTSVRIQTLIPDASSPWEYTYELGLPADVQVTVLDDGSAIFTSADGQWLGGAAPAWAKDASGADVPTRFRVEGTALIQEVDLRAVTQFPVVADPFLGIDLFSKVTVGTWNGDKKVNLWKSAWGNANNLTSTSAVMRLAGWDEAVAKAERATGGYKGMMSKGTMRQQYNCHVAATTLLNGFTGEWNLERARSTRPGGMDGWMTTSLIRYRCNW